MLKWLRNLLVDKNDPVYNCELYNDDDAGSCAHVNGMLCNYPRCSLLTDYKNTQNVQNVQK